MPRRNSLVPFSPTVTPGFQRVRHRRRHPRQICTRDISSGLIPPFRTPFTTVSTAVVNNRTDQAVMSRQELIRLQRTIGFSQSLLQYLGTFSREYNRPAAYWPQLSNTLAGARWDMNNLSLVIPDAWIVRPGGHGHGSRLRPAEAFRIRPAIWLALGKRKLYTRYSLH